MANQQKTKQAKQPKRITDAHRKLRAEPILTRWAKLFDLYQSWDISYHFVDHLEDGEENGCEITFSPPYKVAAMHSTRQWVDNADDDELERGLLHELVHVLLMPIRKEWKFLLGSQGEVTGRFKWAEEETVDHITNSFVAVWNRKV